MKKIALILIVIIITINSTYWKEYVLTWNDKLIVNKLISNLKENIDLSNPESIKIVETSISKNQKTYKNNERIIAIFEEIRNLVIEKKDFRKEYVKINYWDNYKNYKIDIKKINLEWTNWHNQQRTKLWLSKYTIDDRLMNTASEWSRYQCSIDEMTHKRVRNDSYYNYPRIEKWFNDRWVNCEVLWWVTSSESISKYSYYCTDWECSDELIDSLKEIFNIYMSEKTMTYPSNAHYRAIINNYFTKMWMGISIKKSDNDYYDFYVTTHYCTKFKN